MKPAIVAVLAGCGSSVALHAPAGVGVVAMHAAWVVTDPELSRDFDVATYRDDIYVIDCGQGPRVGRLADGGVVWMRTLDLPCSRGHAIVANADGVVVAIEAHAIALSRDGTPRWEHDEPRATHVTLAASAERVAVCGDRATELARDGRVIATHAERGTCSYDARGMLWVLEARESHGTVAVAADGRRLELSKRSYGVAAMPDGFVVADPDSRHLSFVDFEGMPRWFINIETNECELYPHVIAATPTRVVASVPIACGARGVNAFGDVTFENEETERATPLAKRTAIVQLAMPQGHAIAVDDLGDGDALYHYALLDHGVVAFGQFEHDLNLGTSLHVIEHRIDCRKPHDEDDPKAENCKEGYDVFRWSDPRPFVAVLGTFSPLSPTHPQ